MSSQTVCQVAGAFLYLQIASSRNGINSASSASSIPFAPNSCAKQKGPPGPSLILTRPVEAQPAGVQRPPPLALRSPCLALPLIGRHVDGDELSASRAHQPIRTLRIHIRTTDMHIGIA